MTIGIPFNTQTASSFTQFVQGLALAAPRKPKKSTKIISIVKTKKSYTVKVHRDPKQCLRSELQALADSVSLTVLEVEALLRKRKIPIVEKIQIQLHLPLTDDTSKL
jgi:hypothetical protein